MEKTPFSPESPEEFFFMIIGGSLLTLLTAVIAFRAGFYRKLPASNFQNAPTFSDVLFVFALFFGIHLFILPLGVYVWHVIQKRTWQIYPQDIQRNFTIWFNISAIWCSAFGLWFFSYLFKPTALSRVAENEPSTQKKHLWLFNYAFGVMTWFICYPLVCVLSQVIELFINHFVGQIKVDQVAVKFLKMSFDNPVQLFFYLIGIVFIVPMMEEFMFRGILQGWLRSRIGRFYAIVSTSVVFALLHYSSSQGLLNIQLLPMLFLLSCYLGYLYERQSSLFASIGLHSMFNFISAVLLIYREV